MIQHTQVQWSTGIWYPGGLVVAAVENDDVPIDAITNAFIAMAHSIGLDPIADTVKEGPAGLIARLETAGRPKGRQTEQLKIDSLGALGSLDTSLIRDIYESNRGNGRALIYPSGRAMLSYLYDTPFFNALDELIQHGSLSVRGKHDRHQLSQVHIGLFVGFYQGALVNLTTDRRVQMNMSTLLRQMLVFWPTFGGRRHTRPGHIGAAIHKIERVATDGIEALKSISEGRILMPDLPREVKDCYIDPGVAIRYTILNREQRVAKLALSVAFWRIAGGGRFEITQNACAVADMILHLHEMGGRLMELSMTKGVLGHEFMRLFLELLSGEELHQGSEIQHASDANIGATATQRLASYSVINSENKLADDYRLITGKIISNHLRRWRLLGKKKGPD